MAVRGLGLADGCKDIYGDSQLYSRTGVETIVSVPERTTKDNKLNELVYVKAGTVVAILEIDYEDRNRCCHLIMRGTELVPLSTGALSEYKIDKNKYEAIRKDLKQLEDRDTAEDILKFTQPSAWVHAVRLSNYVSM